MLGWHISVYRLNDGGARPATWESDPGERLAVWQTGLGGLEWIGDLVGRGQALDLGGDGYPMRYSARARDVMPVVRAGPPGARARWVAGPHDVIDPSVWAGATTVDDDAIRTCGEEEWLLLEAWDES